MKIQILVDNPKSWMIPYAKQMNQKLMHAGHDSSFLQDASSVVSGDILILLSCEGIFKNLHLNKHNLVVHESNLPLGRGWSPLTWQVLSGASEIPVTLLEAQEKVDSGVIYNQITFPVLKTDLVDDLRAKQAQATEKLILDFVKSFPQLGREQQGTPTFYKKRKPEDGEVFMNQKLEDIWPLLQVSDNERYPAFVIIEGQKIFLRVSKN